VAAPRTSRTAQAAEQVSERINPLTVDLAVTLGTEHLLRLERPIVVAAGPLGFGNEAGGTIDLREVGLFVTRGVSLAPRSGPSLPRIVEVPGGLLHAILRENPGVDDIIDRHASAWRAAPCAVALSLVATDERSLTALIARVESRADQVRVDAYELDLTSPSSALGGARWESAHPDAVQLIHVARESTELPIIVKISPDAVSLRALADAAADVGASALSISGSPIGFLPSRSRTGGALAEGLGELSGPLIRPRALAAIVAAHGTLPIIGGGGIGSPADALDAFAAGAGAVRLGSARWADPRLPRAVLESARRAAAARGLERISDLAGLALSGANERGRE
jgi:dihydroorotate dehydrogenase (NAD+) catalytic subunit